MVNDSAMPSMEGRTLRATHVYGMAIVCLAAGLGIGSLLRGSRIAAPRLATGAISGPNHPGAPGHGHMLSLDELKQAADKQAAPLLQKLKGQPNDADLLMQIGAVYHTTHQYKDAASYYNRAAQIEPRNVALRTKLAASLYRSGDIDGAIVQLNQGLVYEPKDANSLFNLGLIKWQGNGDDLGALAAWQRLLKTNPQLSTDRKVAVQKLMYQAQTELSHQNGIKGVRIHDRSQSTNQ